jgi:hypothetical protein
MPNWRAVRRPQAPATLKSRFWRQVPLSGEESPTEYLCQSTKYEVCFAIALWPPAAPEAHRPERWLFRQTAQIIVARPLGQELSVRHGRGLRLRGARGHDLLHHRDEPLLLGLAETFQRLMMRRTRRRLDLP